MNYQLGCRLMLLITLALCITLPAYQVSSKSLLISEPELASQQRYIPLSQIKLRLRRIASLRIRERRLSFTKEAGEFMEAALDGGAARVYADGATEKLTEKAEANTIKLVDELTEEANSLGGSNQINQETIRNLWNRICPLYPFC